MNKTYVDEYEQAYDKTEDNSIHCTSPHLFLIGCLNRQQRPL
jgi:hypothetical protein